MKELRQIAYHEAGHAVISWMEGTGLGHVTIKPAEDSRGRFTGEGLDCSSDEEDDGPVIRDYTRDPDEVLAEDEWRKKWTRVTMAGSVAEHLLLGLQRGPINGRKKGDGASIRQNFAASYSTQTNLAWVRWLYLTVRDDLRRKWLVVEALAEELLKRETLSGDEMRKIIKAADEKHYPRIPDEDEDWGEPTTLTESDLENLPF